VKKEQLSDHISTNQWSKYRQLNGKMFRYGFTTGSCAAAAAKASVLMLVSQQLVSYITIETPAQVALNLAVYNASCNPRSATCFVVKDAGDDPDITNGIEVHALAKFTNSGKLEVKAGQGIGVVTKKGLSVPVGHPAINPVPMQMIVESICQVVSVNTGIEVELTIPKGIELAKRTFNERLGIVGGLSILGTSGIVVPMSDEAFKDTLALELSILAQNNHKNVVLVPGNYGDRYVQQKLPHLQCITTNMGNFVGFMLHECARLKLHQVGIVGHIGKLCKIAGGIFHTHSSVADARMEVLAAHYMLYCKDADAFCRIMQCTTTDMALEHITKEGFFDYLANMIKIKCEQYVHQQLSVEVLLFGANNITLGNTHGFYSLSNKTHS
jgi:cobalt-precorrin-5B (C1)-methyltransferase